MRRWKERISRWKFDRKMQVLITIAIIVTTLLVLIISTISSVTSLKNKSIELLQARNDTLADNFQNTLEEYKTLAIAMVLDRSIQNYLRCSEKQTTEYSLAAGDAYNVMSSCENMHSDMNFLAVVSYQMDDYLYRGKAGLASSDFQKVYKKDVQECKNVQESTIKMGFSNAYFKGKQYTVNVYFPVYNVEKIMGERGLLCMNFSSPLLEQILEEEEDSGQQTMVVDTDGMLVAAGNTEKIGETLSCADRLKGSRGTFMQDGRLYIYRKVNDWNYYFISSIKTMELYKPSIHTILFMSAVLAVLVAGSLLVVKKVIKLAYKPLWQVVQKMDDVASGSLSTRIDAAYMGEDFEKLAIGFNSMMEEILVLMEQVKLEQHQIEQIRFNSLQSQIQPHFLYNTLDCIHWQAVADGNEEISTLVKALARYYRICLSKGHDVISLEMEMEHVRNYLIIQNMRYDHIIGSSIEIDEACKDTRIPKLTLQPLVENSIYHGIKIKEGGTGSISLKAVRQKEYVRITIADTGTGMTQAQIDEMNQHLSEYDESFGYGVRNVNKRIELLFGTAYGLHYLRNNFGGVTVEILLPYVTEVKDGTLQGDIINV